MIEKKIVGDSPGEEIAEVGGGTDEGIGGVHKFTEEWGFAVDGAGTVGGVGGVHDGTNVLPCSLWVVLASSTSSGQFFVTRGVGF